MGLPDPSQTFLSDKSLPICKSFGQFHGGEVVQNLSEVSGGRGSREGQQQPLAWLTCPVRWKPQQACEVDRIILYPSRGSYNSGG